MRLSIKTPSFGAPTRYDGGEKPGYRIPRGCEIDYWLNTQDFQRINWDIEVQKEYAEKSKVSNYIILDDDSDMLYNQREHFFKTTTLSGLNTEIAKKAIFFLNKPIWEIYYEDNSSAWYDESELELVKGISEINEERDLVEYRRLKAKYEAGS